MADLLSYLTRWKFEVERKPLDVLEDRLGKIQSRLSFLGAAEVVRGVMAITERFSGMTDHLQAGATAAGLTVEALQKLQFAGSQSSVSAEEMTGALTRLTRTLHQAKKGSEQARAMFQEAGIDPDTLGSFKTGADAMSALADRMQGIKDPIQKQAIAMSLLGKGSSNMVVLLNKGSKGIRELGEEAEAVGAVLSQKQTKALADAGDALSKLGSVMKAFVGGIAARFSGAIEKGVDALLKLYAAHRKFIEANIDAWVYDITYAFGFVFGITEGLIKKFAKFAEEHEGLVKWGGKLVLALGGLALAGGALSVAISGGSAVLGAMALVVSPMTLTVAALALGFHDLWTILSGGKFEDTWFYKLNEAFKSGIGSFMRDMGMGQAGLQSMVIGSEGVPRSLMPDYGAAEMAQGYTGVPAGVVRAGTNLAALGRAAPPEPAGEGEVLDMEAKTLAQLAAEGGAGDTSVSVSAPITINVPSGTPPDQVGRMAREGVREHLDRVMRETRRGTKGAVAY